ncbi:hypothetical protein [Cellulomonas sp. FA1]|uniref:hypothetical protein n=1 Tax=Cellulomonas sp. FA1 TaxID=1346710 RepID=UPI00062640A2|nr:hypothetical protein [Cellulomonas sp. FA1]
MAPDRTPDQVRAAAAAMDCARAAGLPDDVLLIMLAAREAFWGDAPWPSRADLGRVLAEPAVQIVDEMLWWTAVTI